MTMMRMTTAALAGVVAVCAGVTPAAAQSAATDEALARATDRVSGATVALFAPETGRIFEIALGDTTVVKRIDKQTSITTVRHGTEVVTVVLGAGGVRLDDGVAPLEVRAGDRQAATTLVGRLRASAAIAAALDVLERVSHVQSSPIAHAVLATRVMLMTVSGDGEAAQRLGRAVAMQDRPRARPVAYQMSAGDCWDEYAQEAIEAYIEYEDCVDNEQWWDVAGLAACLGIYELRAVGAFTWWLSCVGLRK